MTLRPTSAQVSASFVKTLSFLTLPCAVTTDPTRFGHLTSFYSANFLIESCQVGWCVHFEQKCTKQNVFYMIFTTKNCADSNYKSDRIWIGYSRSELTKWYWPRALPSSGGFLPTTRTGKILCSTWKASRKESSRPFSTLCIMER